MRSRSRSARSSCSAPPQPLPFTINAEDGVNEERRLEYRFLDLRRERMHRNIMLRYGRHLGDPLTR